MSDGLLNGNDAFVIDHLTAKMADANVTPGVDLYASETTTELSLNNGTDANQTFIPLGSLVSLNYNMPTMIIVASVLFVVIVATAFGNFLVVLALFKYKYLRTISNYLIGNLAISDFLLATTILPLSTINECLGHWVLGQAMCNFWLLADVLYCTASIWNLCIIAFDRFTATLYPLWYREKRSTMQAAIYVALVWVISAAICMPPLLGWNEISDNFQYDNNTNVYRCILFETPSYVAYSASGSFYIPFFITFFLYVRIFTVLHKRMRKMRLVSKMHQARNQQNTANNKSGSFLIKGKKDKEMGQAAINEGSGNTEEVSSKSLFGSDSGCENDDDDDDEDDIVMDDNDDDDEEECLTAKSNQLLQQNRSTGKGAPQNLKNGNLMDETTDSMPDESGTNKKASKTGQSADANSTALLPKNGTLAINSSSKKKTKKELKKAEKAKKSNKVSKSAKKSIPSSQKRKYEQREMRATIRMAIIIAFFCGMWLGFFTTYFVRGFCSGCVIPRELDALFFWLGYSNSSVNPILYTIFNEEFRKAFQKILGCYRKGSRISNHQY